MKIQYTHGISADHGQKFLIASVNGRSSSNHYYTGDDSTAKTEARHDLLEQMQHQTAPVMDKEQN